MVELFAQGADRAGKSLVLKVIAALLNEHGFDATSPIDHDSHRLDVLLPANATDLPIVRAIAVGRPPAMSANSRSNGARTTWNPIVGCSIVSPGCTNCYAMRMAARIEAMQAGITHRDGHALCRNDQEGERQVRVDRQGRARARTHPDRAAALEASAQDIRQLDGRPVSRVQSPTNGSTACSPSWRSARSTRFRCSRSAPSGCGILHRAVDREFRRAS